MNEPTPLELLQQGDALLVVEMQPDFCPGGALPVAEGDAVIPVLNAWIRAAVERGLPVCASRDWHPLQHSSFQAQGGLWPPHCVQDTPGAQFHPLLELPETVVKISKGTRLDRDQYSAFDETGLASYLRGLGVQRLWVGGLAEDVCVRASALDAAAAGFQVRVLADATRPLTAAGGAEARAELREAGVVVHMGG